MLDSSSSNTGNPYVVNVITFSGHGFTKNNGDAIAVIPNYENNVAVARFINFTDWALNFAVKKHTITLFILSMCRI